MPALYIPAVRHYRKVPVPQEFAQREQQDAPSQSLQISGEQAPTFAQLGVPDKLVYALKADGKRTAFPIQADTLPDALNGRDVLGRGRTGSGKTLAFCLPMITRIANGSALRMLDTEIQKGAATVAPSKATSSKSKHIARPYGLILAPTRELANQIDEVLAPLAARFGIRSAAVYGGVRYDRQIRKIAHAGIVVACPGRLEDLIRKDAIALDRVGCVVIDEADEMADMGFIEPVTRLLEQVHQSAQKMLFSATLDHGVDALVERFLHNPRVHHVDEADAPVATMTHHVFIVSPKEKNTIITALASGISKRILFTRTKFQAQRLAQYLIDHGIPAAQLHGDLNQSQRDRNLQAFERGQARVMVATDVAARGIDVSDVELVVQVDPPQDSKSFTHRSGRTARAGQSGHVVTLALPNQRRYTRRLMAQAGIHVKPVNISFSDRELVELVGTVAEKEYGWQLPVLQRIPRAHLYKGQGSKKRSSAQAQNEHKRRANTRRANAHHGHRSESEHQNQPRNRAERRAQQFAGKQHERGAQGARHNTQHRKRISKRAPFNASRHHG